MSLGFFTFFTSFSPKFAFSFSQPNLFTEGVRVRCPFFLQPLVTFCGFALLGPGAEAFPFSLPRGGVPKIFGDSCSHRRFLTIKFDPWHCWSWFPSFFFFMPVLVPPHKWPTPFFSTAFFFFFFFELLAQRLEDCVSPLSLPSRWKRGRFLACAGTPWVPPPRVLYRG